MVRKYYKYTIKTFELIQFCYVDLDIHASTVLMTFYHTDYIIFVLTGVVS